MITLPPLGPLDTRLWHVLLEMSEAGDGWTLIGGQMVFLLGLEHDATPPRISTDIDVVVDIRAQPPRMPDLVSWLNERGFELGDPDPDGHAHRFTREAVTLDLLTVDGAGTRARRGTSSSTLTPSVSGGTFALRRSRDLDVSVDGRIGHIPCPDVIGALIVKSRAALVDHQRGPDRHLRDLAFLYSLVSDPIAIRERLDRTNRTRLGAVAALDNERHFAWLDLGPGGPDAFAARSIITGTVG